MAYTAQQLLLDVLPRIGNLPPTGMTFYGAANSINNIIYKELLDRHSDLLATGVLSAVIPAQATNFPLPSDFYSMAEKPHAVECNALVANLITQLAALGVQPGPISAVQDLFTSTSGTLLSNIQTIVGGYGYILLDDGTPMLFDNGMPAVQGVNVQSIVDGLVRSSACNRHQRLEPDYLDDDTEHNDWAWWDWYGSYGVESDDGLYVGGQRGRMKIISTTFYQYPKRCNDLSIKGRYFQMPTPMALPTDIIPFNSLFDMTYREGVVLIVKNGLAVGDPLIDALIERDVSIVVNSRVSISRNQRLNRGNFV